MCPSNNKVLTCSPKKGKLFGTLTHETREPSALFFLSAEFVCSSIFFVCWMSFLSLPLLFLDLAEHWHKIGAESLLAELKIYVSTTGKLWYIFFAEAWARTQINQFHIHGCLYTLNSDYVVGTLGMQWLKGDGFPKTFPWEVSGKERINALHVYQVNQILQNHCFISIKYLPEHKLN